MNNSRTRCILSVEYIGGDEDVTIEQVKKDVIKEARRWRLFSPYFQEDNDDGTLNLIIYLPFYTDIDFHEDLLTDFFTKIHMWHNDFDYPVIYDYGRIPDDKKSLGNVMRELAAKKVVNGVKADLYKKQKGLS